MRGERQTRAVWAVVALGSALVGCGYPKAPAYPDPKGDDAFVHAEGAERPGIPNDAPQPLRLRPGDTVSVEVISTESQSYTGLVLDGTGGIHLPLAGNVSVVGKTLTEAEQHVQEALKKFDRLVHVNLQITARGGQRVTILGAVVTQGPVEIVPAARLTDILAAAGGPVTAQTGPTPVPVADLDGAVVMRDGKPLPISLAAALRGDPLHNVYVRPGDHIYVPPATGTHITILGQVGTPQVFAFRNGLRLTEALALAGGINVGGDKSDVRVIRGTLEKPRVYQASLRDVVDGDGHDVALRPGDIVFVTDHPIEDFGEVMSVISPALSLGLSSVALGLALENR